MSKKSSICWSSVGRKFITGLTGVLLFGFVTAHLIGNLTLLLGPEPFNAYANFLSTLGHGCALYVAEAGLIGIFLFHIIAGVCVALRRREARPTPYQYRADAGGPSQKTLSSQTMLYTGIIMAAFLIIHILQFRLGPQYETTGPGERMRDLYNLVQTTFTDTFWVISYCVVMMLLGFHLRHGFWSMFQSLGLNNKRLQPLLTPLGVLFAVVLAVGFLLLPVYLNVTWTEIPPTAPGGLP